MIFTRCDTQLDDQHLEPLYIAYSSNDYSCELLKFRKATCNETDCYLLRCLNSTFLTTLLTLIIEHFPEKRICTQFIVYHMILLFEWFPVLLVHTPHSHTESDFEQF